MPVPYRIETSRLVLRCFRPEDATLRKEAVDASAAHLQAMPRWPNEPEPLAAHVERVRKCRGMFDLDQDQIFAVFDPSEARLLGEVGFLTRAGPGAREIGYWLRVDEVKKGFTTEAVSALAKVAFELMGIERLDLRCDVDNAPSAAVARKVGFVLEGTLRHRKNRPDDVFADDLAFSMIESDYAASLASRTPLRALDVVGAPLLSPR